MPERVLLWRRVSGRNVRDGMRPRRRCLPDLRVQQFCLGTCRPGIPCTPQNCNGCCVADPDGGVCLPGTNDNTCGNGGDSCQDCQSVNEVCASGNCTEPCSPSTCPGCCDGNICAEGDQNFLCGMGGSTCVNCEPQGQVCTAGMCQ